MTILAVVLTPNFILQINSYNYTNATQLTDSHRDNLIHCNSVSVNMKKLAYYVRDSHVSKRTMNVLGRQRAISEIL
jgi:hypothetical protein